MYAPSRMEILLLTKCGLAVKPPPCKRDCQIAHSRRQLLPRYRLPKENIEQQNCQYENKYIIEAISHRVAALKPSPISIIFSKSFDIPHIHDLK